MASWFSLLSKNEDFVTALRHILREATCRLILKMKDVSFWLYTIRKIALLKCLKMSTIISVEHSKTYNR